MICLSVCGMHEGWYHHHVLQGGLDTYAAATIQGSNIVERVQRVVSHDCVGAAQVRRVLLDSPWTGTKGDKRRGGKSNGDSTAIDECADSH